MNAQQRENWEIANTKDHTGLYALKRKKDEWRNGECLRSYSVSVYFDELHSYNKQYTLLRNGIVIAIINNATARINNLSRIDKKDFKAIAEDFFS